MNDPVGGRPPRAGARGLAGFRAGAVGSARRAGWLGILMCFAMLGHAATDESRRPGLKDPLLEDVRDDAPVSDEPQAREPGRFLPRFSALKLQLAVTMLHDDNVLRSSANEESSLVIKTAPKALLEGRLGRQDIRLGYEGEYGNHLDKSDENYFDHEFIADADLRLSRKLKVTLDNGLLFGHDPRGAFTSRLTGATEPDRWRRHHVEIDATFGRAWNTELRTKGGIGAGFQQSGIRYLNNDQGARDFDRQSVALKGRYNVGPTLSVVADAGLSFTDYTDPATPLDSQELSGLLGIAWEVTAKTSGEVKFGILDKDFDDPGQNDFTGANFDAEVTWSPKSFSAFTAYASRDTTDSGQAGGSAVVDTAGLRWRHGFSERLLTESGIEFQQADFESDREDDLFRLDASAAYRLNRFVRLRAGFEYLTRSSNDASAEYDNSIVFIELDVTLERRAGGGG